MSSRCWSSPVRWRSGHSGRNIPLPARRGIRKATSRWTPRRREQPTESRICRGFGCGRRVVRPAQGGPGRQGGRGQAPGGGGAPGAAPPADSAPPAAGGGPPGGGAAPAAANGNAAFSGGRGGVQLEPPTERFPFNPNGPPVATFFEAGANMQGGLPYTPWAADLKKQRMAADPEGQPGRELPADGIPAVSPCSRSRARSSRPRS